LAKREEVGSCEICPIAESKVSTPVGKTAKHANFADFDKPGLTDSLPNQQRMFMIGVERERRSRL
jgi:hypothetical protein